MPIIAPFKAYRYSADNRNLKKLLCPPYDIIDEKLERALKQTAHNAIHIELPSGEGGEKYLNAARVWNQWRQEGQVVQDSVPAFYIYEQVFKVQGKRFSRVGFFCELKVEKPGAGSVLRHELTLSKPKADRLNLIRSLQINTSPIFGLFSDPKKIVGKILAQTMKQKPLVDVSDRDGVIHRLWECADPQACQRIAAWIQRGPVLIADGHHRYETSWNYAQENLDNPKAQSMLFFLCPIDDPGLVVFPTHRVFKTPVSWPGVFAKLANLKKIFSAQKIRLSKNPSRKLSARSGFIVTDGKTAVQVRLKSAAALAELIGKKPKESLNLALVQIHSALFPEMKKEDFTYVHEDGAALRLAKKNKTFSLLVPPTSCVELDKIVRAGELMPQKSTYFYPKLITGLLFRSIQ